MIRAINYDSSIGYNPSFKALKAAQAVNSLRKSPVQIDLYKLNGSDKAFLNKFRDKVKFSELYPKLSRESCERLQKVFTYCIQQALEGDNITYIAVSEDKLCGIMTYYGDNAFVLDGICAIPTEPGKKLPGVGKTLFYQLFSDAKEAGVNGITLGAIIDGPFDVVKKYEELGFVKDIPSKEENYATMTCNRYKVKEQLNKLSALIEYNKCELANVNLEKFLD